MRRMCANEHYAPPTKIAQEVHAFTPRVQIKGEGERVESSRGRWRRRGGRKMKENKKEGESVERGWGRWGARSFWSLHGMRQICATRPNDAQVGWRRRGQNEEQDEKEGMSGRGKRGGGGGASWNTRRGGVNIDNLADNNNT